MRDPKFDVLGSTFRKPRTSDLEPSPGLPAPHFSPFSRFPLPFGRRHDRETHRAHETHLVDLFSHVNFHFVSSGFPGISWRGEGQIATVIFERNLHGILADQDGGIETGYGFRVTASEYLESLIMLVQMEHNENSRGIGTESVGRFDRYDLMRTVKSQFLIEAFRRRNGAE